MDGMVLLCDSDLGMDGMVLLCDSGLEVWWVDTGMWGLGWVAWAKARGRELGDCT
jgi:hypothetical protein